MGPAAHPCHYGMGRRTRRNVASYRIQACRQEYKRFAAASLTDRERQGPPNRRNEVSCSAAYKHGGLEGTVSTFGDAIIMTFKLTRNDRKTLAFIAEHRLLTIGQIALARRGSHRGTRRRLAVLEQAQIIRLTTLRSGHGRGRPKKLVSLSESGVEVLRSQGIVGSAVPAQRVTADKMRHVDHLLLTNSFRLHLSLVEELVPTLRTRFLSPTSPFLGYKPDGRPLIADRVPSSENSDKSVGFVPDGVFGITDVDQNRTVLFFLEVDMGSEAMVSQERNSRDVRQKILNYQAYFRSQRYKRYEQVWDCPLCGFRLLVLAVTADRLAALSRLARDMPPSDFVWLTDQSRLSADGVWGEIWVRGGHLDAPPESILDSRKPGSPSIPPVTL